MAKFLIDNRSLAGYTPTSKLKMDFNIVWSIPAASTAQVRGGDRIQKEEASSAVTLKASV
jgi:hypothetical protein